ncbi:Med5-domain-containing protein [Cryphonectria parasitica EP155]|uniref:Mediator of RNA polymerase II transcription subunit 5 n=1 Tax=Cryphonectria parasitica (strain ATCC 38755 / EP155) TaxID=660469 RepID=A0A9P5CTU7_CRYP1|nr:Med5-domain-containing protein [Cryphonectria parasitica EP155]KAF3770718.1 Med5-domain-containing protein [Cryphonectria parasitica EP155]
MGDPAGDDGALDRSLLTPQQRAEEAYGQWDKFLTYALKVRLDPDRFAEFVPLHANRHPLGPLPVADLFLRPNTWNKNALDPRVPFYLQTLLELRLVDLQAVLAGLLRYSSAHAIVDAAKDGEGQQQEEQENNEDDDDDHKKAVAGQKGGKGNTVTRWQSSFTSDEVIFYRLRQAVGTGSAIRNGKDAIEVSLMMARWMMLFTSASAALPVEPDDVMMDGITSAYSAPKKARDQLENARAGFVMLLLSIVENPIVLQALSKPVARGVRKALSKSLANFVPSIIPGSAQESQGAAQIASRLEMFRTETLAGFEPVDKKKEAANAEIDELFDETVGLQSIVLQPLDILRSRAGLYIYLNAALIGRPLLDDASLYSYLHNRFEGDIQLTTIDLILASFDVLANAIFRNEGQRSAHLLRSYLINKVPLILASFAATASPMYPFNSELCITNALSQVDTNTFPTLSSLFENGENNPFTESVRSDFVTACCLHGLVPESSIDKLLGDYAYQTLPAGGRYVKDKLVQECTADHDRMLRLITELDKMEGNAGAVCQALTEMLGRLCANKETMTLKQLCSQLARNPLNLDVLLLFDKPHTILTPLCELLDNWGYEDDQGEYQPVYEEFGSVLLLLLAFVYRYNLSASDLALRSPDSFIAKLLGKGQLSRSLDGLSEPEKSNLNGWIHGLFDTDGGGLADDLLSSCPPQNLYLLIPTLFHNIVLAFSTGYLSEESLKTGIEYLVEPFLLPSLVTAIIYLANCLWTDRPEENKAIIKILQLILRPTQKLTQESSDMLNSVRNIVAKPLENGLRNYQRQNPKSQDVEPLLQVLKDNIELSRRAGAAPVQEVETWSSSSGGLVANIKHTTHALTVWSLQQSVIPTAYSHRQILVGLKLVGAKRVLRAILEELKAQTEAGNSSISYGYDVAAALVCAPDVTNAIDSNPSPSFLDDAAAPANSVPAQRHLSLREALKWEAEEWKKIQKKDPVMAEIIVRLYQKVEKQMTPTALAMPALDTAAAIADALVADDAAAAAVMADPMSLDSAGVAGLPLDLSAGAGDLGLDAGSNSAAGLDLVGGDDWGLDGLDGWDANMDLT